MREVLGPAEPKTNPEYSGSNAFMQLVGDRAPTAEESTVRGRPVQSVEAGVGSEASGAGPPAPKLTATGFRLYERDHVLSSMRTAVGQDRGYAGRLICIESAPGLGKTALLNAFHHIADDAGLTVLRARCSEHEMEIPFALARRLLAPSLGCGTDLASKAWEGLHVPDRGTRDVAPMYDALNTLLASFGRVFLAIDDLQWADPQTVAWLQFVSRRLDMIEADIAVSTLPRRTGTPLTPADRLSLEPAAEVFVLQPLRPATTALVMQDRLGDVVTPELARTAHHLTGGNPFLLVALIDEVATRESTPSQSDLLRLAPPAVMRWTLRRLSNLPSEAHDLLGAVSVLGPDADLRSAAAVAEIETQRAGDLADLLADESVLTSGRPLNFISPLVRSSVYHEISAAKRSGKHLAAARLIAECGGAQADVAAHLLKTEPQNQTWIVEVLSAAARDASIDGLVGESLRYLERARVELLTGVEPADFHLALAEIEARFGRSSALDHFRAAVQLEHNLDEVVASGLRMIDSFRASPLGAVALVDMLCEFNNGDMDPRLRLRVELASAVLRPTANSPRSLEPSIRAQPVELAESAVVKAATLCQLLGASAEPTAPTFGEIVDAVQLNMPLLDSEESGQWIAAEIQLQALTVLVRGGAYTVAEPFLVAARAKLREWGHLGQWKAFSILLAQSFAAQGRLVQAEELLGEAMLVELDHEVGRHQLLVLATSELGALQGGVAAPEPTWPCGDELTPVLFNSTESSEIRGRLHLLTRDWEQALAEFDRAADFAAGRGVVNSAVAMWRVGRCEALLGLGRTTEAADVAAENLRLARQFGAPVPIAVALKTAAMTATDDDSRVTMLEDAMRGLSTTTAELWRCRVLIDLGVALRRSGDSSASREALRESADLAVRIGAKGLIACATQELRASGGRPRRLVLSGTDSLTPAERKVALLAATGHTNSAIAKSLYVGIKTIESHLARAYRKLGIKSRSELPSVLDALSVVPDSLTG